MRHYKLYVEDDRADAPLLMLVECLDDARAQAIALRYLGQSPHHHAVEVMYEGRRIFQAGVPMTPGAPLPPSASTARRSGASNQ